MTDHKEQRQTAEPTPDDVQDPRHDSKCFMLNGKPAYYWGRRLSDDEVEWILGNV